ncbi:hypothetical protein PV396_09225 [Streptomyces sp. ME02-8801-2C]|uniref:hypothetical protein n=1 Tax=Streptomyces sp. ME02-8801-2C TaxID=3028680 RepID=UPI0029BC4FC0|nr:hypothetical protein [Streptomyces sp. ME02-8801-2C]MDX3452119.1 hypothetical protein [Streptomyces sp. ME02-8801-2C]
MDFGEERAVRPPRCLGDLGCHERRVKSRRGPMAVVADEERQQPDRGRPPVVARLAGQIGADVPGGGIGEEPGHEGVRGMLAPQPVQGLPPEVPGVLQVVGCLLGVVEERGVQGTPSRGWCRPQRFQVREEADRREVIVRQVGGGRTKRPGQDGPYDRIGEFDEGRQNQAGLPAAAEEVRGSAPHLVVGVAEPGLCGVDRLWPGPLVGHGIEEIQGLAADEGAVRVRELEQPGGDGAGAFGAYGLEERDTGGVGGRRGGTVGHGLVRPRHRVGRWSPFRGEVSIMRPMIPQFPLPPTLRAFQLPCRFTRAADTTVRRSGRSHE